ncbi:ABC transporter substrate-binding protein [Microbacterium sp. MMO-10]|uniref:ABC transporter substrate-binding protein n=1 Tax=Microbacterium sp. MMO-10 TaxID=3081272 RepID=UPI0030167DAA
MNPQVPRRRRRLLIALTVAAALITTGCSAGTAKVDPSQYRTIPASSGKAVDGGVITVAMTPGLAPNYIFPYPPAEANGAVIGYDLMWRTLYRADVDGKSNADTSLAEAPVYGDDGRTVTITLKKNDWSNGKPLTAGDVVFSLDILKAAVAASAANWAFYTPGQFPDGVTATASGADTVVLTLEKAYNPAYLESLLQQLVVLPSADWSIATAGGPVLDYTDPANAAAIYTFLTGQSADQSSFATNPLWQVVSGPYALKSFEPTTGSFSLTPNPAYTGPGEHKLAQVDFKAFTSAAAVYNQYQAGTVTVGRLDSSYSSKIEDLRKKGYDVYAAPAPARSDPLVINFANTTGGFDRIIAQPYVRQALQHLVDQPGYIKSRGVYNGAASENYATVGLGSAFPPAFGDKAPYPFDPKAAEKLLTEHGWKVDKAGTVCEKPGAGSGQCGEGIEKGQKISFTLASASSPSYVGARDLAFSSEAKNLGIDVKVVTKSLNYMYENYTNPGAPANADEWGMQDTGPLVMTSYPTANGAFNTDGSFNLGSYSNPEADKAIEASVFGSDPKALSAETTLISKDLPVLFLPTPDNLIVWKSTLSGPPETFEGLLKFIYSPEQWYFTEKQK